MGSLAHSPWQCLQCNKCHASISLPRLPPDTHHNQPTVSLMVAIHLQIKVIPQLVTPRVVHTLRLPKVIPRVVPTHRLVTHHKVPTPRRKVPTPHRVTRPSKAHTSIGETPLPGT